MVKITDVATKAGVAKSTVSNVLTGNKYVSEELRIKVLKACEELNFQPNFYASGLSRKKTNIIALLLENLPDLEQYAFYKDLMASCLVEASKKNYSLLIYYYSDKEKLLDTLRQGRAPIDGAILMSPLVNDLRLAQMESDRTKCVIIGRPESTELSYVDIDNKKLVATVCAKLIGDYGKNIFLINSSSEMTISQDRRKSFLGICETYGIDGQSHIFESCACSVEDGYKFSLPYCSKGTAFLTANERVADGVYRAVAEKGLSVGKDVAVFSLGCSQSYGTFSPKLSYAEQDYTQLGKDAVNLLVSEIENEKPTQRMTVDSRIVYTESTER